MLNMRNEESAYSYGGYDNDMWICPVKAQAEEWILAQPLPPL
jgi:hypothetical protein